MVERICFWIDVKCPVCEKHIGGYHYTVGEIITEVIPWLTEHAREHDRALVALS